MTTNSKKGLLRLAKAGFVGPRPRSALVLQSGGCAACDHSGKAFACGKLQCLPHHAFVPKFGRCDVWASVVKVGR